jgi:hypothetical protein
VPLLFPVRDGKFRNTLKVGQVVGDQGSFRVNRGGGNQKVGVRNQCPVTMQVTIDGGGSYDHPVGEGKDQASLAERVKRQFSCRGSSGLKVPQQLISRDDGKGQLGMLKQVGPSLFDDHGMLFQKFGEDVCVEYDERLGH